MGVACASPGPEPAPARQTACLCPPSCAASTRRSSFRSPRPASRTSFYNVTKLRKYAEAVPAGNCSAASSAVSRPPPERRSQWGMRPRRGPGAALFTSSTWLVHLPSPTLADTTCQQKLETGAIPFCPGSVASLSFCVLPITRTGLPAYNPKIANGLFFAGPTLPVPSAAAAAGRVGQAGVLSGDRRKKQKKQTAAESPSAGIAERQPAPNWFTTAAREPVDGAASPGIDLGSRSKNYVAPNTLTNGKQRRQS